MCGLKCWIRVVVIALIIQSGHVISTGPRNGTAEILWRLSQLAIEGRQKYPSQFQLHPEQFSHYTGPIKPVSKQQYGLLQNYPKQRPSFQRPYPDFQRPYRGHYIGFPKPIPALPPGYQQYQQYLQNQQNFGLSPQSFMGALQSIAQNDDLHCVPRLLCELTSGPSSGQKHDSFLPFNINTESLIGLLSAITGPQTSPLLEFGKAALLGYSTKDNSRSCLYAYPRCPREPDRLVEYLNNHNGGFFRFFNGVPPSGYPQNLQRPFFPQLVPQNYRPYPQNYPPYPQNYPPFRPQTPQQYPLPYQQPLFSKYPQNVDFYQQKKVYAEKRIQNQLVQYLDVTSKPGVRFPNRMEDEISNEVLPQQESVVFPEQVNLNRYEQQVRAQKSRRQKAVAFPATHFGFREPNLKQVTIFPDRTGTGELRLDADELENYNYDHPHHSNVRENYRKLNGISPYFNDRRNLFKFPLQNQEI